MNDVKCKELEAQCILLIGILSNLKKSQMFSFNKLLIWCLVKMYEFKIKVVTNNKDENFNNSNT